MNVQDNSPIDEQQRQSDMYWAQAEKLKEQGQYLEAAQLYAKGAEAENASSTPRIARLTDELHEAGLCYEQIGQPAKALDYYEQALELNRKAGREIGIADSLYNMSGVYYKRGQYAEALDCLLQALEFDRKMGNTSNIASELTGIALNYKILGQYDNALTYSEQALELERKLGREDKIATLFNNIGKIYTELGLYPRALESYEQALELERKMGRDEEIALCLRNIGEIYQFLGQYPKALDYYEQALKFGRKVGSGYEIAGNLYSIGRIYDLRGQLDKGLEYFEQALECYRELDNNRAIAMVLSSIGGVYRMWGHYGKALDYYEQSLKLARNLGMESSIALQLNSIGEIYEMWGQYVKALDFFEQALELARKVGKTTIIVATLNNIGRICKVLGQYAKALDYYEQALELVRMLGRDDYMGASLNNLGVVYRELGQYPKALASFERALELARKLYQAPNIAKALDNIGIAYRQLEKYPEAITHLGESVGILEQLRKTAAGDVRRDYLAAQIHTYQFLTSCYVRAGDFSKAFETIELSRAKRLAEQLAGSEDEVKIPSIEDIQSRMAEDTVVLIYSNLLTLPLCQVIITKHTISAAELPLTALQPFAAQYFPDIIATLTERGKITRKHLRKKGEEEFVAAYEEDIQVFEALIEYYRLLLMEPEDGNNVKTFGAFLYNFLIGSVKEQIEGKTRLLIAPDGMLNFLPFETLVDERGQYWVENYTINYAQSLSVLELIGQRQYASDRSPLLAFGGAVYEAAAYAAEMLENEGQLAYLQRQADEQLSRGSSMRAIYSALGYGVWDNLPGTLREVEVIRQIVDGADILTGAAVTKTRIKALSADGTLATYKALHFATHALAVPEVPELSALVLSQTQGGASETPTVQEDDGYLRVAEIAQLALKADFVNLSACETGLGKVYSGEGVVGLTQAFLLAGANGVSVSLWYLADESTAAFMVDLYKLVTKKGVSCADALTAVKRRFIAGEFGEAWKAPYCWAPFVYYGKP